MRKIARKFKVMDMRVKGFYGAKARWWMNSMQYDKKYNTDYNGQEKNWAYKNGFLPEIVNRYGINETNKSDYISVYDYAYLYPVNDIFRKWIKDKVTTRNVLKPYKEYLPEAYFHLYMRDGSPMIIKLADCPENLGDGIEDVLQLIRDKKQVYFAKTAGFLHDIIKYEDEKYYYNDEKMNREELLEKMERVLKRSIRIIMEINEEHEDFCSGIEGSPTVLRLLVYNKYADNPKIGQAYLRYNTQIVEGDDGVFDEMGERVGDNVEEFKGDNQDQSEIEVDDGVYEKNFMEDEVILPKRGKQKKIAKNIYVPVSLEDGSFCGGKCLDENNKIVDVMHDVVTGRELKGVIPNWEKLNEVMEKMCLFIPQIELMEVDVMITKDGFKFVDFSDHPYYPQVLGFNEEMTDYFKMKIAQKYEQAKDPEFRKANLKTKANTFWWIRLTRLFSLPAMRPLIYKWWYITVKDDLFSRNGMSLRQKLWAYKRGFLSYRLEQYGITKDNYRNFISDYDYRYLRHINNKYRVWMEDKITVKYICDKYAQFFPKYYYHVSVRNGEKRIIPLMDLPEYCDTNLSSIFKLVENVGALACKPQRGSQGQGFYKFSYEDGKYYLNHVEATKEQVLEILDDADSQYLITEYIQQHPVINKIYSGAVNTLRIITFMKDGKTPEIGNAYMRFGSEKTGAVDNMGAGGMFVQVDMETGRFYNGKIITENSILPCSNHPDTGELIEGYLPNWDIVKQGIIDLNLEVPQLEYLGFDVAITEDGMKLPEINRAPGYPKIETFNRPTIDYLLYKRAVKMEKNNITKTKW